MQKQRLKISLLAETKTESISTCGNKIKDFILLGKTKMQIMQIRPLTITESKLQPGPLLGRISAGVEGPNVDPSVAIDIYQTGVSSVLQFGCNSICINKINMNKLDQQQSMLIKSHLGLKKYCRTSVLLKAIRVAPLSYQVTISNLDLLKKCILNTSLSQSFYCYLLTVNNSNHGHNLRIADTYGFHLEEYIFCDNVVSSVKRNTLQPYRCAHGTDGLVDSIRSLPDNYSDENRNFLNLLLKTF